MRRLFSMFCLFAACVASARTGGAQQANPPADVPAVTPAVQTAEWAVSWWLPRHESKKMEAAQVGERAKIVFLGDSITQGWEGEGKDIWQKNYAQHNAFNLGSSGDRTEQVLWRLEHGAFDHLSPEVVVLLIGTNNTGHRQDPAEQTTAGIEKIIDELHKRLPKAEILLLSIFPRGVEPNDALRTLNADINSRIAALDERDYVTFLDIGDRFVNADGKLRVDLMPDALHLNAEGYAIWAEAMAPTLEKMLK